MKTFEEKLREKLEKIGDMFGKKDYSPDEGIHVTEFCFIPYVLWVFAEKRVKDEYSITLGIHFTKYFNISVKITL